MLATAEIIEAVADVVDEVGIGRDDDDRVPFVVDPVAASMYGEPLLDDAAMDAIRTRLFPRAALATPNLDEVRLLVGVTVTDEATAREAATALHALGARCALASATCAGLARGLAMPDAVAMAERYIRRAVAASYPLGAGTGPVSPLWAVREWWAETS
jgi:hydroxymethylpyrimidine/phosphomethylpyrimidine kinase